MTSSFHHNVILASFWIAYEVFRDPVLLSRVREEVKDCQHSKSTTGYDVERLIRSALLQSLWAETLRLRVHIFNTRSTGKTEVELHNWIIPKNSVAIVSSTPAHMDTTQWNTGLDNEHPIDTFWADRFIVYDDPLLSGSPNESGTDPQAKAGEPRFEISPSMSGAFIPFGGGSHACPGRQFAKRQALLVCAVLAANFDIELDKALEPMQMDWSACGLGTLKPLRALPYRISTKSQ